MTRTPPPARPEALPNGIRARLATPEPAPNWTLGFVVLTFIAAVICFIIGSIVALTWLPDQPFAVLIGWTLGAVLITLFVVQLRLRRAHFRDADPDPLKLRPRDDGAPAFLILFVALGFAIAIDLISASLTGGFSRPPELLGIDLRGGNLAAWLFAILFMVAAQPIAEEIVFRGVAYPALRAAFGLGMTLLFCAGLHAIFHLIVYPPNYPFTEAGVRLWWGLGVPFLDALVITLFRAHQKSTRAAIIAHAAFGLFAVIKLLVLTTA